MGTTSVASVGTSVYYRIGWMGYPRGRFSLSFPGDRKERAFSPLLALDFGGVDLDDTRFNLLVGVTGAEDFPAPIRAVGTCAERACCPTTRDAGCVAGVWASSHGSPLARGSLVALCSDTRELLTISPWLSGSTAF